MYKVLITDGMSKSAIEDLKESGYNVDEKYYEPNELGEALNNYDVVVVRSATKVRKEHIDKAPNLKLIIRGGVGVDNIDVDYAKSVGKHVRNTPGASARSVAELAMAHMFSVSRFIPAAKMTMSKGAWDKKKYKGCELGGKTLGIIGMGKIGRELAKMAAGIGMNVIYNDVCDIDGLEPKCKTLDLENLYKNSDYISVHIPVKKGDKPVIGEKEFSLMKDGAILINCARGGVVDENALLNAIKSGKIRGAGVDVFCKEPICDTCLTCEENISVTPHIGAQTLEAQERIGAEVVGIIKNFFEK